MGASAGRNFKSLNTACKSRRLAESRSGEVGIEYALIAALITVLLVGAMARMGDSTGNMFDQVKLGWEEANAEDEGEGEGE